MTHNELMAALVDKMPKMNTFDLEILKDIIAGIALRENSIYDFYRDVTTSGSFIDISTIQKISKNYTVPSMYREHIDTRFDMFKENVKIVCYENSKLVSHGKRPGFDPNKWLRNKKPMFGSTEKITIDKANGLDNICNGIMNVGQFDYLKKLYEESATDVSKVKYALMMKSPNKRIGGRK